MRQDVEEIFEKLAVSEKRYVIYFEKRKRFRKTWGELSGDIDHFVRVIRCLEKRMGSEILRVGIVGPISYSWMVLDLACLKGGFIATGLQENTTAEELAAVAKAEALDILLADHSLKPKLEDTMTGLVYYYNCASLEEWDILSIPVDDSVPVVMRVLDEFGSGYTSGTSRTPKRVRILCTPTQEAKPTTLEKWLTALLFPFTFWARKDNRLIIFMPFSHIQQRQFVKMAFINNVNIILSDEVNCIRHIITEKPNVMVGVPLVFDIIAGRIKDKLTQLTSLQKRVFRLYNRWGINGHPSWSPLKRWLNRYLFPGISKLYGGRADYFVVGSAKSKPDTIRTFYSVGVKVLESYGLSETGIISMNSHWNFRIGSVGKPGSDVRVSHDGEVLLKMNQGYYHDFNRDVLNIDEEGYIHTGDLGYIDKRGYLFLQGRMDEVIVLENGHKVFSGVLEEKLNEHKGVRHAVVFSESGKYLKAILDVELGIRTTDLGMLIATINAGLPGYEQIREFRVVYDAWHADNGFITGTFKTKRNKILASFGTTDFLRVSDYQATVLQ